MSHARKETFFVWDKGDPSVGMWGYEKEITVEWSGGAEDDEVKQMLESLKEMYPEARVYNPKEYTKLRKEWEKEEESDG